MNRLGARIKLSSAAEKVGTSVASSSQEAPVEEFGNAESIMGTAGGDETMGMNGASSQAGSSFADRASEQKLQQQQPKGHTAANNTSYYEDDDSALIFGDDPEKAYFEYILQQEQEQRARQGKSAEDSLLGDSTVEEIQMNNNGPWKQNGGQDSREVGPTELEEDSYLDFPILSSAYNNGNAPPSIFGGYSLATTEKSPTVHQHPNSQTYPATPAQETPQKGGKLFPDVIYLTDAPPTPATTSSRHSHEESKSTLGGGGRGACFYAIIFLLGGIALAGVAVAIFLSLATDQDDDGASSSSSMENGNFNTIPPFTPTVPPLIVDDDVSDPLPTVAPSLLLQKRTDAPTWDANGDEDDDGSDDNIFNTNNDDDTRETAMPTWNPTSATTKPPTRAPLQATNKPVQNPTNPEQLVRCGCKDCAAQLWRLSDGIPCVDRIEFLKNELGYDEDRACRQVAGIEFPMACSGSLCNPDECSRETNANSPAKSNPSPITAMPIRQPTDVVTQSPITRRPTPMPTPRPTNMPTASPITPRPTNNPTPVPSLRPTAPEPTRRPTARPTSLRLTLVGNNGSPGDVFPLGRCEGDCDSDDECGEGLVCFQRDPFDRVPGCNDGENESSNTDFCVPEGLTLAPIPTFEPTWEPTFSPTFGARQDLPPPGTGPIDGVGDIVCGLIGVFC